MRLKKTVSSLAAAAMMSTIISAVTVDAADYASETEVTNSVELAAIFTGGILYTADNSGKVTVNNLDCDPTSETGCVLHREGSTASKCLSYAVYDISDVSVGKITWDDNTDEWNGLKSSESKLGVYYTNTDTVATTAPNTLDSENTATDWAGKNMSNTFATNYSLTTAADVSTDKSLSFACIDGSTYKYLVVYFNGWQNTGVKNLKFYNSKNYGSLDEATGEYTFGKDVKLFGSSSSTKTWRYSSSEPHLLDGTLNCGAYIGYPETGLDLSVYNGGTVTLNANSEGTNGNTVKLYVGETEAASFAVKNSGTWNTMGDSVSSLTLPAGYISGKAVSIKITGDDSKVHINKITFTKPENTTVTAAALLGNGSFSDGSMGWTVEINTGNNSLSGGIWKIKNSEGRTAACDAKFDSAVCTGNIKLGLVLTSDAIGKNTISSVTFGYTVAD